MPKQFNPFAQHFDHYEERGTYDATCNGCGTRHLAWGKDHNGAWRLRDEEGEVHSCAPMRREHQDDDDFEDLTGDLS